MKYILKFVLILNFLLFAQTHYVSKEGSAIPPFSSWETAANTIQAGLNVSNFGDTVVIANGSYHENPRIYKSIYMVGLSRDSVIVNGFGLSDSTIFISENSTLKNFTVMGRGVNYDNGVGLYVLADSVTVSDLSIKNCAYGFISIRSGKFSNVIFENVSTGISVSNYSLEWFLNVENCDFRISKAGSAISASPFNYISISNCRIKPYSNNGLRYAFVAATEINNLIFKNNIVLETDSRAVYLPYHVNDTASIINNCFIKSTGIDDYSTVIHAIVPKSIIIKNNIFVDAKKAIYIVPYDSTSVDIHNNMYWKVSEQDTTWVSHSDLMDVYPEFVEDYKDYQSSYDLHLDIHSKAIDGGSPDILDKDGSRSDIGAYGGPGGETYEYIDNPPVIVQNFNLDYSEENQSVTATWDSLYASDIKHYRLYRDTLNLAVINEDALLATPSEATYVDTTINPPERYYYYVLAEDSSGQRSGWRSKIIAINVTGIEEAGKKDYGYKLNQNYPNPFNPKTKIEYQLEKESKVSLEVLDIKGERIEILADGVQRKGRHSVIFDGANLASGVYLYRLQVKDEKGKTIYSQGNKMLLLK